MLDVCLQGRYRKSAKANWKSVGGIFRLLLAYALTYSHVASSMGTGAALLPERFFSWGWWLGSVLTHNGMGWEQGSGLLLLGAWATITILSRALPGRRQSSHHPLTQNMIPLQTPFLSSLAEVIDYTVTTKQGKDTLTS